MKGFVDVQLTEEVCYDGDFIKVLTEIFSSVLEIHKYLKITETPMLKDLGFFTSLQRIRGIELSPGEYSLVVKKNQNMRHIWLPSQNVSIDRGAVDIDSNPNLCNDDHCKTQLIQIDIVVNSVAAKIMWKLPEAINVSRYTYHLWRENEYLKENLCRYESAG